MGGGGGGVRRHENGNTKTKEIRVFKCRMMLLYLCNSYTMVCPPVRGDHSRALASGLSLVQADRPWYNFFITPFPV